MARYIDADKLKDAFHTDTEHLQSRDEHLFDLIMIEIEDAPTADVVEVKHGYWTLARSGRKVVCSCCEKPALFEKKTYHTLLCSEYCPYCGAKMDGGKEE